jgi:tetratricopeptide (TPR) repeat protein
MRIHRSQSRLSFRRQRRRSGCVSLLFLLSIVAGTVALTWAWLERRDQSAAPSNDLLEAAQNAFGRGDLDLAVTLARQYLSAHTAEPPAVRLLARALVYRSYSEYNRSVDRESAVQLTTEAVSHSPGDLELLATHAFTLQAAGQPARAAEAAQTVLEQQPNHTLARTALALAYGGAGSYEISLRESLQAVQGAVGDDAMDALRALAISYSDLGNYAEAIRTVERAMTFNSKLVSLYFERALYALQLGDADAATVAYFQVLVYDPDNVKARLRLCELSGMMREHDAALTYCGEVTQYAPNWSEGWYQLGREHFLAGNFANAQQNLHQCAALQTMQNVPVSERRFECWYLQGQAAQILGDCAALIDTYNEFRSMAADEAIQQTWMYPPEGPPGCATPSVTSSP